MAIPPAERFAAVIGALGVSDDSRVVVYDRRENMWAARLWWMLRAFGFDSAAVLDGGWTAWRQGGYPVCSAACSYPPGVFTTSPRPEMIAGKQDVLAAIGDVSACLINALGRRQHRGEVNEYGRRGHIPGSRNVTAWEILDRGTQRYRPLPQLQRKVGSALDGLSNREIAQNLFVTARTVEGHLTHAYQKLAITSREQLPAALTPKGEGADAASRAFR